MTERAEDGRGYRAYERHGWEILVGKSARDNDNLTFRIARPADLWLHATGYAGSHVVVRNPEEGKVPREVIEAAAQLAAFHSKARGARGKVDVHLCRAAAVRKRPGAPRGQVIVRGGEIVKVYVKNLELE